MKFLCPQCKAKYQIPDEKIAGRTLRMKCRRCEHDIIVKGDTDSLSAAHDDAARAAPRPAAGAGASGRKPEPPRAARGATASRGSGSGAGPLPKGSALGADFRKNVGQVGHAEPQRPSIPSPLDAWHVAINDVPVGPMRREELARKIAAGAVTGDSLCWREGYDDWRPVRDTELSSLLTRRSVAPPAPAPAPRAGPGAPPARGPAPAARPAPAPRPAPTAGRPAPGARPAPAPAARPAAAARSNVVPIGGRHGAAAAPQMDDQPDSFDENEATTIAQSPFEEPPARPSAPDAAALGALAATSSASKPASVPPPGAAFASEPMFPPGTPMTLSEPPAVKRGKGLPVGAWMGIVFAGAAGAAIAVILGLKFILPAQQAQQQAVAENDTHVVAPPSPTGPVQPVAPQTPPPTVATNDPPTNDAQGTGNDAQGHRPTKRTGTGAATGGNAGGTAPPTGGHANLSAADRAALAALAADGESTGPTNVPGHTQHVVDEPDNQGPEMSADQLRTVVQRGRPALQHCYELVARQTGSSETMRVDVHIVVGGSGVITRADATGNTDALNTCIEREVRRWHFPGGGEASFPLVFQPQGG